MPYRVERVIPESHPGLPGHFPGNPVVPGVVILDMVLLVLSEWRPDSRVIGMPDIKFVSPLLPGQPFTIELRQEESGQPLRFECRTDEQCLARGRFTLDAI
jgi:3-hydroxymyristoyl/3-hydroxydecanoyl-(acyl carrier protein) dehydratase